MSTKAVLRNDLSITSRQDEDGRVYQVVDPQTGDLFEFGEKEWFLLSHCDGESFPPELIEEFEEKFNTEIATGQLESLITLAKEWGLFRDIDYPGRTDAEVIRISPSNDNVAKSGEDTVHQAAQSTQRFGGGRRPGRGGSSSQAASLQRRRSGDDECDDVELNWTWFNPNDLFLTLSRLLSPLRYVLYVLPVMVVIAIFVIFNNAHDLVLDHMQYRKPLNLLQVFVFGMFTVNLLTQGGRGIICRGLGLNVDGFGIRMILGILPRFGVHVRDVSRLDRKTQMWAHASPFLIRLSVFSFCTVLWIATRTNGTTLPLVFLMMASIAAFSFVIGSNPLIKTVGYKFLITWLEIPNLRKRAKRALFSKFRGGKGARSSEDSFALRAYAISGLLFWILILGFLWSIAARWLETNFQGTGVVIFLLVFSYFVLRMMRGLRKRITNRRSASQNMAGVGARQGFQHRLKDQTEIKSIQETEQIKPDKKKRKWLRYVVVLVLLIVAFLPYPYETGGPFSVLPVQQEWVYTETEGVIKKVFHNGNEYLDAGTVIARLSSVEQEQAVHTTAAAIMEQKAELQILLTTPTKEELELAEKKLDTARVQLKYSKESEARLKRLYEAKHVSFEDYEDAKRKMDVDSMEVEEAKASLSKVKAGPHPQEIEAARSELKRLEERLKYERMQLEMTNLVMPIDGYLVTRNLKDKAGQFLNEGEMFAVVEDSSSVRVEIEIPEADISEVMVGADVRLKVWTYPDQTFEGQVTEIDRSVTEGSFGEVVIVAAIIPNSDGLLQSGMTGFGKVDGGSKYVIVAFTRMLVRFFQIELWSWIP
jgi:putative peptide zinc metalloprotease protein